LVPEALWREDGSPVELAPPTDDDVARVLHRALGQAKKDWADLEAAWPEDEYEELQQLAIHERLGMPEPSPRPRHQRRVAVEQGFSLHADTAVHAHDRQGLERLARYGARGPVSECRLTRLDDGQYQYTPKKGLAFALSAEALVRRLVALMPPARLHLTSFHGVYAPHAALRPLVTLPPPPTPAPPQLCFAAFRPPDKPPRQPRLILRQAQEGRASPAHLRHRRPALPVRWATVRPRPLLHPQGRRGAPRLARRYHAIEAAPARDRTAPARPRLLATASRRPDFDRPRAAAP